MLNSIAKPDHNRSVIQACESEREKSVSKKKIIKEKSSLYGKLLVELKYTLEILRKKLNYLYCARLLPPRFAIIRCNPIDSVHDIQSILSLSPLLLTRPFSSGDNKFRETARIRTSVSGSTAKGETLLTRCPASNSETAREIKRERAREREKRRERACPENPVRRPDLSRWLSRSLPR